MFVEPVFETVTVADVVLTATILATVGSELVNFN